MEFTVRISRFHLAALIFILIVLAGIGYTTATQAEGVWHSGDDVIVTIADTDKTLQEAIFKYAGSCTAGGPTFEPHECKCNNGEKYMFLTQRYHSSVQSAGTGCKVENQGTLDVKGVAYHVNMDSTEGNYKCKWACFKGG